MHMHAQGMPAPAFSIGKIFEMQVVNLGEFSTNLIYNFDLGPFLTIIKSKNRDFDTVLTRRIDLWHPGSLIFEKMR